ncbi:MAG: LysR family transcriptional regulator [Chloroflexi bacterium]|nr:LysR family transcriptional regulator [Chloroflexota bacterium]
MEIQPAPADATRDIAVDAPTPIEPRSKIWFERGGRVVLSEWRVQLLVAIDECGSLVQAAQRLGVPYRTAWQKLKEAEEGLGFPILETQSGGAEGGSSRLTARARDIVERFNRATSGISAMIDRRVRVELQDILG